MKIIYQSKSKATYDSADLASCDDAIHSDFQMFTETGESHARMLRYAFPCGVLLPNQWHSLTSFACPRRAASILACMAQLA